MRLVKSSPSVAALRVERPAPTTGLRDPGDQLPQKAGVAGRCRRRRNPIRCPAEGTRNRTGGDQARIGRTGGPARPPGGRGPPQRGRVRRAVGPGSVDPLGEHRAGVSAERHGVGRQSVALSRQDLGVALGQPAGVEHRGRAVSGHLRHRDADLPDGRFVLSRWGCWPAVYLGEYAKDGLAGAAGAHRGEQPGRHPVDRLRHFRPGVLRLWHGRMARPLVVSRNASTPASPPSAPAASSGPA